LKGILTTTLVLFFCIGAIAQKTEKQPKVETVKTALVLVKPTVTIGSDKQQVKDTTPMLARLYRFKNARILKELAFKTKNTTLTV
jgi:hypothetical protein